MLEETGLKYEPHVVRFDRNDQLSPEFLSVNPNNKIPAILDPQGPGGQPLVLFESGAILVYLAEKTGRFICRPMRSARYHTLQWLMFQMGGLGPMFGQLGFFHRFAGKDFEDKRPRDRYVAESKRLLAVSISGCRGRHGLSRMTTPLPISPFFPGCEPWSHSMRRAIWWAWVTFRRLRVPWMYSRRGPAVVRGLNIPERPKD